MVSEDPDGEISGGNAAHADPYAYCGLQVADMRFVDVQRVVAEHHHGEHRGDHEQQPVHAARHDVFHQRKLDAVHQGLEQAELASPVLPAGQSTIWMIPKSNISGNPGLTRLSKEF